MNNADTLRREHTVDEENTIALALKLAAQDREGAGMLSPYPLVSDGVRIIPGPVFSACFGSCAGHAVTDRKACRVWVNRKACDTRPRLFATLLHEAVHAGADEALERNDAGRVVERRIGWRMERMDDAGRAVSHFRGLAEYVVDRTVRELAHEYSADIALRLNLRPEEFDGPIYTYFHFGSALEPLFSVLGGDKAQSRERRALEGFAALRRGQYTGERGVLAQVDVAFGPGTLRLVARLGEFGDAAADRAYADMLAQFFIASEGPERVRLRRALDVDVARQREMSSPAAPGMK